MGEDEFLSGVSEGEYYNGMSYKTMFYYLLIAAMNVHDLGHPYVKHKTKKYLGFYRKKSLVQRKVAA